MKNLLIAMTILLAAVIIPLGPVFASEIEINSATSLDPIDYDRLTVGEQQPPLYNFVPTKSITAYELAMILKEVGLSFYMSEDDYSAFPQELKKHLKKED